MVPCQVLGPLTFPFLGQLCGPAACFWSTSWPLPFIWWDIVVPNLLSKVQLQNEPSPAQLTCSFSGSAVGSQTPAWPVEAHMVSEQALNPESPWHTRDIFGVNSCDFCLPDFRLFALFYSFKSFKTGFAVTGFPVILRHVVKRRYQHPQRRAGMWGQRSPACCSSRLFVQAFQTPGRISFHSRILT